MRAKSQIRNRYILFADIFLVIIAVLGSYALRLEMGAAYFFYLPSAYWMLGAALIIKPLIYYFFGLYRRMWIYASMQEMRLIVTAVTAASILLSTVMLSLFTLGAFYGFPRSVLVIDWLVSVLFVGGIRFAFRLLAENRNFSQGLHSPGSGAKKALIIGAGDAGALVVRELQKNPQLNVIPVGFLDDNPGQAKTADLRRARGGYADRPGPGFGYLPGG